MSDKLFRLFAGGTHFYESNDIPVWDAPESSFCFVNGPGAPARLFFRTANQWVEFTIGGSPVIVVDTVADVRSTGDGAIVYPLIFCRGHVAPNDGGARGFYLSELDTTSVDNGGTIVRTPTTNRCYVVNLAGGIHAEWFGVKADGFKITDGVRTAGNARLVSPSAPFTPSMVGMRVLLREPSHLAAGTFSVTSGQQTVTLSGENLPVDLPVIGGGGGTGQPASGGAIYSGGHYMVAQFSVPSTHNIVLAEPAPATITAQPWYAEVQTATTIVAYVSPTEVTLGAVATIDGTGLNAAIATGNAAAYAAAIAETIRTGKKLISPDGCIGLETKLGYTAVSHVTIEEVGRSTLWDMRLTSFEETYASVSTTRYFGLLSFVNSDDIHIRLGLDANLPIRGIVHSAGGVSNASGARQGLSLGTCTNSSVRVRSEGFGARDEFCYVDGDSQNFTFEEGCRAVGTNNVSLNFAAGFDGFGKPQGAGLLIHKSYATGVLISSAAYAIEGLSITNNNVAVIGGGLTLDTIGTGTVVGLNFHDLDISTQDVGALDIFGNTDATSSLTVSGVTFNRLTTRTDLGAAGVVSLRNYRGTVHLNGVTADEVTSASGGRFVTISGPNTGSVHVGPCKFRGRAGSGMTIGVHVMSDVPGSATVTVDKEVVYGESVTERIKLDAPLTRVGEAVTIAATGTTALSNACEFALVTANGSVTLTLPSAANIPGRRIVVKNAATQLGTTTVSGSIDAVASIALTGAGASAELEAVGGIWREIFFSGGFVPSTTTLTATFPLSIDGVSGSPFNLLSPRTFAVATATTLALGAIQLAADLRGDASSGTNPTISSLTGLLGVVSIPSATVLDWNSTSGPEIGTRDAGLGLNLKVRTANQAIALVDGVNLTGFFTWNSGATFYQVGSTATSFSLLANAGANQALRLLVGGTTPVGLQFDAADIYFRTGASANKGRWTDSGLRVGDGTAVSLAAIEVVGTGRFTSLTTGIVVSDANGVLAIGGAGSVPVGNISPGTVGQFLVTNAGPVAAWATAAGDWIGAAQTNTVVQLTGAASSVAVLANTSLDWASGGPSFGPRSGTPHDASIKVNTANSNIVLFDGSNIIGFYNYNSGSPFFQQFSGAGFQIISTGGNLQLRSSTASTAIEFKPGGATVTGHWTSTGLRIGDATDPVQALEVVGTARLTTLTAGIVVSSATGVLSIGGAGSVPVANISPGTVGQILVTTTGPVASWQTAGGDWTGAVTANTVVHLTGSAGSVGVTAGVTLDWASSGPTFGARGGTPADAMIKVNTSNSNITLFDGSNLIGYFNWNSGNPFFQSFSSTTGFTIQVINNQVLHLDAASTGAVAVDADVINFNQSSGSAKGRWTSGGLRVGDGATATDPLELLGNNFSWDAAASAPKQYQKDLTTAAGTGATMLHQAQNASGTGATVGGAYETRSGTGATPGTWTAKIGTTARLAISALGIITISAYGTGILQTDSAGVISTTSLAGMGGVPTTRTLTGTAPITIDGVNTAVDLSANRTIAVSGATTGAVGVVQLAGDLGGTGTAASGPTISSLTGLSNVVSIPSATTLDWNSTSGPRIATRDSGLGLNIGVRTTGNSVAFVDVITTYAFFNYNSGNPFLQALALPFAILTTGANDLRVAASGTGAMNVDGTTVRIRSANGGTTFGNVTSTGARFGDGTAANEKLESSGNLRVNNGSGPAFTIVRDYTASNTYSAIYMGGVTPGSNNYAIVCNSSELILNAPGSANIGFRIAGAGAGNITTTGLRVGDTTTAAEKLDVVGNAEIRNSAGTAFTIIRDYTASNSYGAFYMGGVTPASGNHVIRSNGTDLHLNAPTTGGKTYFRTGDSNIVATIVTAGMRVADDGASATDVLEVKGNLGFDSGSICKVYQQTATSGNGKNLSFIAQAGFGTGDTNGGTAIISGGANHGAGLRGGVKLIPGGSSAMVQISELIAGQRFIGFCGDVTTTEMPASTGDRVGYWADCAAAPTANPTSGSVLFGDSGSFKTRSKNGLTTTLSASGATSPVTSSYSDVVYESVATSGNASATLIDIDVSSLYGGGTQIITITVTAQAIDSVAPAAVSFQKIWTGTLIGGALTAYGNVSAIQPNSAGSITPTTTESLTLTILPFTTRFQALVNGAAGINYNWIGKAEVEIAHA